MQCWEKNRERQAYVEVLAVVCAFISSPSLVGTILTNKLVWLMNTYRWLVNSAATWLVGGAEVS